MSSSLKLYSVMLMLVVVLSCAMESWCQICGKRAFGGKKVFPILSRFCLELSSSFVFLHEVEDGKKIPLVLITKRPNRIGELLQSDGD